jgi:O-antigen/teichoic acid export membrane protein
VLLKTAFKLRLLLPFGLFQLVGTISGALAAAILVRRFGLDGAGQIAYLRNAAEFAVTLVVFGLPQAIAFQLAVKRVPSGVLLGPALAFTGFAGVILYLAFLTWSLGPVPSFARQAVISLWLASIGILAAQLWRSFLLPREVGHFYSLASISTNLVFLFIVSFWPAGETEPVWWGISAGWAGVGVAIIAGVVWLSKSEPRPDASPKVHLGSLLSTGWWVWLQQIFVVGQIALMFHFLQFNAEASSVGVTATALVLYNAVSGPAAMIAPALFRLWAGRDEPHVAGREFIVLASLVTFGIASLGLASIPLGKVAIELAFGQQMAEKMPLLWIYLCAAWIGTLCKLAVPLLQAYGATRPLAISYLSRFFPVLVLFVSNQDRLAFISPDERVAIAYLIGEVTCLAGIAYFSRRILSKSKG